MSYEIRKVANGYMVFPAYSINRDRGMMSDGSDYYVFETWEKAAEWLRVKFSGVTA